MTEHEIINERLGNLFNSLNQVQASIHKLTNTEQVIASKITVLQNIIQIAEQGKKKNETVTPINQNGEGINENDGTSNAH